MDTAFHSIIEHIGTLNLNNGDFLEVNNAIKKAFDTAQESEVTIRNYPCDFHIGMYRDKEDTNDAVGDVNIHIYEIERHYTKTKPPRTYVLYRQTIRHGKPVEMRHEKPHVFFGHLKFLYRMYLPNKFNIREGESSVWTRYETYMKNKHEDYEKYVELKTDDDDVEDHDFVCADDIISFKPSTYRFMMCDSLDDLLSNYISNLTLTT